MIDPKDIFIHARKDLTLTAEERSAMRAHLEAITTLPPTVTVSVPSPLAFFFQPGPAFAFVVALVVFTGGGASLAAEGALPGDTLYSVKLGVNERLERAFAVSEVAKANVEVRHAEERLQEVELLAAKGSVEELVVEEAVAKVESHVERVSEAARVLAQEGDETSADAVHTRLSSALAAHAEIIRSQSEEADREDERHLRVLALKVENAAGNSEDAQDEEVERPSQDDAWAERLAISREESVRTQLKKLSGGLSKEGITPETQETLNEMYRELETELALAAELSAEGEYREAANAYEKLERKAYRTAVLLASAKRIEDKTNKEVLITIDRIVEEPETIAADAAAPAMMLMKAAAPEAAQMVVEEPRVREEFRFRVRDRKDD